MNIRNLIITTRNIILRRNMGEVAHTFRPSDPIGTLFLPQNKKIDVHCIIAGYPRTGTHWIRNVIEKSAGIRTYNIFQEKLELDSTGTPRIVKIHARSMTHARLKALLFLPPHNFKNRFIYAYRDPRDCIISLFEMYKYQKDMPGLSPENFVRFYDPLGQYRWEIDSWVIPKHSNVLLVKYEKLKDKPEQEFRRIFEFAGIQEEPDAEAINQKVSTFDEKNRPRAAVQGWRNAPAEYAWLIRTVSSELSDIIRTLGYEAE